MFDEKRAASLRYDPTADTVTIELGPVTSTLVRVQVDLLLDKNGRLVGVDLGGHGPDRIVVLVGGKRHEDVDRTRSVPAEIARDSTGKLARVIVSKAKPLVG
jgi:hypothetical protein